MLPPSEKGQASQTSRGDRNTQWQERRSEGMGDGAGLCHEAEPRLAGKGSSQRVGFARGLRKRSAGARRTGSRDSPKGPLSPLLPARAELRSLFQARAKLAPVCGGVAGLEATSQQALQRNCVLRRAFASSFAAVKKRAPCSQIKLQVVSGALAPRPGRAVYLQQL